MKHYKDQNHILKDKKEMVARNQEDVDQFNGEKKKERRKLLDAIRDLKLRSEGLRAQRKFIHEHFDLKKWLDGINISNLDYAMRENQNANEIIKDLLNKFEDMKKFSQDSVGDENQMGGL